MDMDILRILLVEDDYPLRKLVCEALELMGHQVTTAVDGRDAIARLQDCPFEAVCTDAAMPNGVLGMEVCQYVTSRCPQTGLVLTSGFPRSALGELPGRVVFLAKPYRVTDLLAAIDNARLLTRTPSAHG